MILLLLLGVTAACGAPAKQPALDGTNWNLTAWAEPEPIPAGVAITAEFADGRVAIDRSDPANPVVTISAAGRTAELPVNQNRLKMGEKQYALEGVVVYVPNTDKAFIPLQAVHLIRGMRAALPKITN